MKKKSILVVIVILFLTITQINAQVKDSLAKFTPGGKVEGRIFSDFYYEFNEHKTAFEITRAYLGYGYNYTENFSARVLVDVSKPDILNTNTSKTVDTLASSMQYTAHLKFAYGTYQKDNLSISFGMIELNQFKLQDQQWGHRYVMKTQQDEYGFCSSADLGLKVDYKLANWISADLGIRNGEGFKKVQADNMYWYGLGFTFQPIKGLYYRFYYDYGKKMDVTQTNITNYLSYFGSKFKAGVEVAMADNFGYTDSKKLYGISTFAAYQVTPKVEVFGRYDNLSSNKLSGQPNGWNYDKDLSFGIVGLQYAPIKNIAIALNGRYTVPENTVKNSEKLALYMSFDFKF